MMRYKHPIFSTLVFGLIVALVHFSTLQATAQQEIQEELYQRDSLIERVGQNNIDTSYTYKWHEDSSRWELYGRDLEFYRANQKLLAVLKQKWQPQQMSYINEERTIKSYGREGKVVESLNQTWDGTQQEWVNLKLKTITYDGMGNKSEILHQEWKRAVGRWISTTRYLIDYNRMGEKSNVVIRTYHSPTDQWQNHQRFLFRYYDGYGHPDEALVQSWNSERETWQKQGLYNMAYNFRGQKTSESRATWNTSLSKWINGIRYHFKYDKDHKIAQILQRWDYGSKQWYNAIRKRFKYNEKNKLQEELTYQWDQVNDKWVLENRLLYSRKKPEERASQDENARKDSSESS